MSLLKASWLVLLCCVRVCYASQLSVKFLKTPHAFSKHNSTTFVFQALVGANITCSSCRISCKLDGHPALDCRRGKIFYSALQDGAHTFKACAKGIGEVGCATYNWTVDTVPPTAYVTASMPFTSAPNISVNISFTEPCTRGGGFSCSSVNSCNLLVYGSGQVIPSSFTILEPNLRYSLFVGLSPDAQYGRVVLVMDKNFCADSAGNTFTRAGNSRFSVHFDRRNVFVDVRTRVPEKLLQLNDQTRMVQATNNYDKLKVYLYFSEPILNSSAEVLSSLNTSQGQLLPIDAETFGNRRFGFRVANMSRVAIVTVGLDSNSIISRQGTPISPIAPVTFLYDTERPRVRLSTTSSMKTRENSFSISINFMKPVFGFNSSFISISGGHLQSFHEISRSKYRAFVQADMDTVSVSISENITEDIAGNKNLASNVLEVRQYSVPVISSVISSVSTAVFLVSCFITGLLTVSTVSLQSLGAFSRSSPSLTSDPNRNLFRTASYMQVLALTRWLPVTLPIEYYEFVRGLQWIIPYFTLPWESKYSQAVMIAPSPSAGPQSLISQTWHNGISQTMQLIRKNLSMAGAVYGLPLTAMEYRLFFENPDLNPEAEYVVDPQHSNGWRDFYRIMFWLAVIGGSLILLHAFLYLILKFRKANSEKSRSFGALIFPRFELFLVILALPAICKAARGLVKDYFKHRGGAEPRVIIGILLLSLIAALVFALFLFLSIGITLGKLLQYKEIHQEGQKFHWYQEIIRVTLGPGKRGQWTWKNQSNSVYLTKLGPLFEDLRGPPKYMLLQISGSNLAKTQGDCIIASDDETEDGEAPCIQKLFGILRIYYTLLETLKRVALGILSGAFSGNQTSKTPIVFMLCITSFQLFFVVLKKPFIKKKVQLVEIISLSCQVGIFASCLVLSENELSEASGTKLGIFMIILFLAGFLSQMANEWYALYRQTKRLDHKDKSFLTGLKMGTFGFLSLFLPQEFMKHIKTEFLMNQGEGGESGNAAGFLPGDKNRSSSSRSSGSTDKPWLRQLREMAKASFSRDGSRTPNDPSSSHKRSSGFWGLKRSGGSSSSSDFKSKPRALYKDLEAIFASK